MCLIKEAEAGCKGNMPHYQKQIQRDESRQNEGKDSFYLRTGYGNKVVEGGVGKHDLGWEFGN